MTASCAYFITGTDTDIGKTLVSATMLHVLSKNGIAAAGMKPIAAGTEWRDGVLHNGDVAALAAAASFVVPRELSTPYLLREPASPHIAAALESIEIDPQHIQACYDRISAMAEAVIVEGVGGFRVPLSADYDTADLAQQLGLPIIMVVGLRLGCINHALITADAIAARGLKLAGWVANLIDPDMQHQLANIETLRARLSAPLLGCVPRLSAVLPSDLPAAAAVHLDFSVLPGWPLLKQTFSGVQSVAPVASV